MKRITKVLIGWFSVNKTNNQDISNQSGREKNTYENLFLFLTYDILSDMIVIVNESCSLTSRYVCTEKHKHFSSKAQSKRFDCASSPNHFFRKRQNYEREKCSLKTYRRYHKRT